MPKFNFRIEFNALKISLIVFIGSLLVAYVLSLWSVTVNNSKKLDLPEGYTLLYCEPLKEWKYKDSEGDICYKSFDRKEDLIQEAVDKYEQDLRYDDLNYIQVCE